MHKPVVARHVARAKAGDFGAHRVVIGGVAENVAVVEADFIERIDGAQIDIVGHFTPAQGPQFFENIRRGDDGRPGVEREAVLAENVSPPAWTVETLNDRHAITARAKPHGSGEPAETSTNNDGVRAIVFRLGQHRASIGLGHKLRFEVSKFCDVASMDVIGWPRVALATQSLWSRAFPAGRCWPSGGKPGRGRLVGSLLRGSGLHRSWIFKSGFACIFFWFFEAKPGDVQRGQEQ